MVAVKMSKKKRKRVRPGASCVDILRNIRNTRNTMTAIIKYDHIDGHMDKYLLITQMTLEQQTNFECDKKANKEVERSIRHKFLTREKTAAVRGGCSSFFRGKKLTNDLIRAIRLHLDCFSWRRTRIINLPANQKGYDTFETTVGKLSARRIQIYRVFFLNHFFDLIFF